MRPPLSLQRIENAAIMAWQEHITKCKPQQQQVNKMSTIKRKRQDPQFQQQQQAGGSSKKKDEKKQSHWGTCSHAGKDKQKDRQKRQYTNGIPATSFSFHSTPIISLAVPPLYQTTIDPHAIAHKPGFTLYGKPAFPHTKNVISLAHHLGITPTIKTVCTLNPVANHHLDWSGGIPINKRPQLEGCIEDTSETTSPSHHHTNTFGGEPLPLPFSPKEKTYTHTWDEDDKEVIRGSKNEFDVDDYYINTDIFNQDQFLGTAEEFSFNMDI